MYCINHNHQKNIWHRTEQKSVSLLLQNLVEWKSCILLSGSSITDAVVVKTMGWCCCCWCGSWAWDPLRAWEIETTLSSCGLKRKKSWTSIKKLFFAVVADTQSFFFWQQHKFFETPKNLIKLAGFLHGVFNNKIKLYILSSNRKQFQDIESHFKAYFICFSKGNFPFHSAVWEFRSNFSRGRTSLEPSKTSVLISEKSTKKFPTPNFKVAFVAAEELTE